MDLVPQKKGVEDYHVNFTGWGLLREALYLLGRSGAA